MQTLRPNPSNTVQMTIAIFAFTLIWNFMVGKIIVMLFKAFDQGMFMSIFMIMVSTPLILVGIGLAFLCILIPLYDFGKKKLYGESTLIIDRDNILPGDEINITYQQTFKANVIMETVIAELIYHKWERSAALEERRKKEHIIDKVEEKNLNFFRGQQIAKEYKFKIPEDAIPTLKSKTKIDAWKIKIKFKPPRNKIGIGYEDVFEFEVS